MLAITGADSAVMEPSQVAATWRLADGALEVTLPGSNYRHRRLGVGPLGEERWLMEQRVTGELAVREIMAVPDADVNIASSQLARRWKSNINASDGSRTGSAFLLRSDGMKALSFQDNNNPEIAANFNRSWRLISSAQVEQALALNRTTNAVCKPPPSDTNCVVLSTRNWRFVARIGNTLFTIEQAP